MVFEYVVERIHEFIEYIWNEAGKLDVFYFNGLAECHVWDPNHLGWEGIFAREKSNDRIGFGMLRFGEVEGMADDADWGRNFSPFFPDCKNYKRYYYK